MTGMHKRITAVFCFMVLLMTGMIYRVYYINATDYLSTAAQVQGKYRVTVAKTRGVIYDRNMNSLVNNQFRYVASVLPTPQAATALLADAGEEARPPLLDRLSQGLPFALQVDSGNIYATGVDLFRVPERYGDIRYAPHLIGYLGDGGVGVAGIERAYEEILTAAGGEISVLYQIDATGRTMDENAAAVERSNEDPTGGVVLTLDRDIQEVVQDALAAGCDKGGAVVMDAATGDILAMASLPVFDQNDIAASLEAENAPFVNRATSGYNIGSVFKLLMASAALENGVSRYHEHDCQGYIEVGGHVFRCNNDAVHGVCDMERALEVSCNSYFISLAQLLPPEDVLTLIRNMGLGSSLELASGIYTAAGNLPGAIELEAPAVYANFSFGQGTSLASPLQMAQTVAAVVNGGLAVTPRLVRGATPDGLNLTDQTPSYTPNRVLSERTAEAVRTMMVAVVEEGSGKPARPVAGGAGGKTSSAQTGLMTEDPEADTGEREIVHAWFAGFYPAENPRYSIVVFVEDGVSGEHVAAPIFKQIADGIGLENDKKR